MSGTVHLLAQDPVLAGDWLNLANDKISAIKGLLIAATAVIAIFAIARTYMRTQAVAPTLMAVIIAAGVVYAVAHMDILATQTGTEIVTTPPGTAPSSAGLSHTLAHHMVGHATADKA